jgi:hypothetical protein
MKIKILADFQKNQLYCDNKNVNWTIEKDDLVNDINKFHFFKFLEIDETWNFEPNSRYIFPIFWDIVIAHSEQLLEEFTNKITNFVNNNIQLFLNKQLILVFLDPLEGNIVTTSSTNYICSNFNNKIENIYYISGNFNSKNLNNFFKFLYVEQWQYHLTPTNSIIEYFPKKDYINLNRMARVHRCILMQKIIDNKLLDNGYNTWANTSWSKDSHSCKYSSNLFNIYTKLNPNTTIRDQTYDILDCEYIGDDNPTLQTPIEFCKKTFIYLVTETHIDNDNFFISEKTYKPIAIGMPFIVLGNPGTLAHLREKGYATFSDWIDESYDKDLPIEERIDIIVQNLIRISKMSDIEKINIRRQMNEICEHNLNLYKLLNRKNNFIEILKLIEKEMI